MTVTLIDGGMGKELLRIGAPFRQPEWSALALMETPERVGEVHRSFIEAGAEVITINSYAVVPYHIGHERFVSDGRRLASLAADLARDAADLVRGADTADFVRGADTARQHVRGADTADLGRGADTAPRHVRGADTAPRHVRVAGCIPPLFGSYEPQSFDPDAAPGMLRVLVEAQAEQADLWIAETVSSIAEATAAIDATAEFGSGQPFWLSVCVPDHPIEGSAPLRSGESLSALVEAVGDRVDALLVNCSQPEMIDLAIDELARVIPQTDPISWGGYANAFVPEPRAGAANELLSEHRPELTPTAYADIVEGWIERGASIVGGCCGIGPLHIAELAARLAR